MPVTLDQVIKVISVAETALTGPSAAATQPGAAPVETADPKDATAGKDAATTDPLAGLSADDRQRITDLQKKIVADLNSGDTNDALDAATQLVSKLIDKANLHQMAGSLQTAGKGDAVQAQAQDLANMVAGSGASLNIQVQTNPTVAADPTAQTAATEAPTGV